MKYQVDLTLLSFLALWFGLMALNIWPSVFIYLAFWFRPSDPVSFKIYQRNASTFDWVALKFQHNNSKSNR